MPYVDALTRFGRARQRMTIAVTLGAIALFLGNCVHGMFFAEVEERQDRAPCAGVPEDLVSDCYDGYLQHNAP